MHKKSSIKFSYKIMSLILLMTISLCISSMCFNNSFASEENPHDNLLFENKSLMIKDNNIESGSVYGDFEYEIKDNCAVITKYIGSEDSVDIPASIDGYQVLEIGSYSFMYKQCKSVNLPNTVKRISEGAFIYCTVSSINFPDSVEFIGVSAFNSSGLVRVNLPSNVSYIGGNAFSYCANLSDINIPDNNNLRIGSPAFKSPLLKTAGPYGSDCNIKFPWKTEIPEKAFEGDETLEYVFLPNTITKICEWAFAGTGLIDYEIPTSVKTIETFAFSCSKLQHLIIHKETTDLKNQWCESCPNLKTVGFIGSGCNFEYEWDKTIPYNAFVNPCFEEINISNTIETVSSYAINYTSLTSLYIPKSVKYFYATDTGAHTGGEKRSFKEFIVDKDNEYYKSQEGVLFNKNMTELIKYPVLKDDSTYNIPNTVTIIRNYAFFYSIVAAVVVPNSVTEIQTEAFGWCYDMKKITFCGDAPSIAWNSFNDSTTDAYYPRYNNWPLDKRQDYEGTITWIPYPEEKDRTFLNIGTDDYNFKNFSTTINREIWFKSLSRYLSDYEIEQLYRDHFNASGVCFGFAMTSALIDLFGNPRISNIIGPEGQHASKLFDVGKNWIIDPDGGLVENYIKTGYTWQMIPDVTAELSNNAGWGNDCENTCDDIYKKTDNNLDGVVDTPIEIGIYSEGKGHALLPIGIESDGFFSTSVIVYDSNFPDQERFLYLYKNEGHYNGWSYNISDDSYWSSSDNNSHITYCNIHVSYLNELLNIDNWSNNKAYNNVISTDSDGCKVVSEGKEYILNHNTNYDDNIIIPIHEQNLELNNNFEYYTNLNNELEFKDFVNDTEMKLSNNDGGMYFNVPSGSDVSSVIDSSNEKLIVRNSNNFSFDATFLNKDEDDNLEQMYINCMGKDESLLSANNNESVDFKGLSALTATKEDKTIQATDLNPNNTYTIVEEEDELKIYLSINDTTVEPISPQTFTGSQIKPSVTVKLGEETLNENQDYTLLYKNNINVGTATVSIIGMGDYAGTKEVSFSIVPKNIMVKADNKIKQYGDVDPQFSGICYEEDEQTVLINPPTVTFSRELGEDLGTYDIYASTTNANYNIIKTTGILTIEQKDIKVVANNISKTFADDDPEITGIVTDTEDNPISNPPVINYSREDGENVGDYDIKATTDNNNFNIVDVSGIFSILTKKIAKPSVLQIRYTGTEQCAIEESDWYTITDINGIYPGDYQSNVSLNDIDNTSWWDDSVVDKVIDWTISKAILMASYAGEEIKFGVNPKLDISVSGFVNGETEKTATGYVAPEIDKPTTLELGEYTLTPYGGEADNYEFNYVSGTLKVVSENTQTGIITDSSKTGDVTPLTLLLIISFTSILLYITIRCNRKIEGQHLR